jgi:L-asparaginase
MAPLPERKRKLILKILNLHMKITKQLAPLTAVVLGLGLGASQAWAGPKIKILATGGTIAGAQASQAEAGYTSGKFSVDDLIKAVPQMKDVAEISGEQVANIGSQTMNNEVWLKLAKRANELLSGNETDGIVITHGTDTMEETGYFLSLVVKSDKPVVLVGSMRPATAISADGNMNLYNAVSLAANPSARQRGPLIVLNDEIHYGREVQKMNSTQLDTFESPNRGRAGVMSNGKAFFFNPITTKHNTSSEFSVDEMKPEDLPRVEVIYSYANLGREMIDYLANNGVKGIVLAGVGDGNTTDAALAALQDAAKKGVAVVRSSRTGSGVVDRNVEVNDDKLGFIAGHELNPQKARVLLIVGLTKTKDVKKLQEYFVQY